ncbi:tetratricopeptide repeat protein [Marinobacterium mangrovicola]|uniref:Tfp pilus assembly protein PilF n=1 Tax=Marinobacterium mangrovicola TaxID=1476959 RepID=A0A4V2PE45_9GAMM|nr:tetratricopeptide repeat protein [Marinobacterium mangrovicola]TCK07546.1 Tfp pilus assembly protein PilF [Marinobacterium mangrovicola]
MFVKSIKILVLSSSILLFGCSSPEEKVETYIDSAKSYLEIGDYEKAHIEFSNALQINPDHVEGLYLVTKVFEHDQEWPKVYRYLQRVLELQPNHIDALLDIGQLELSAQQLDVALSRSASLLKLAPESAEVHAFRALVLLRLSEPSRAVEEAEVALRLDPDNVEAKLALVSERLQAQDPDSALLLLKDVGEGSLKVVAALRLQAYQQKQDVDGIRSVYQGLIDDYPHEDGYYFALTSSYVTTEEYDSAVDTLAKLLGSEPDNLKAQLGLIDLYRKFYGIEKAENEAKSAIERNPKNAELKFYFASMLAGNGQTDSARDYLVDIAEAEVESDVRARSFNMLAALSYRDGKLEEGDGFLQKSLEAQPKNEQGTALQAQRMLQNGDTQDAVLLLRSILPEYPDSPKILTLLAQAHQAAGRRELAADQYAKALSVAPTNAGVIVPYLKLLLAQNSLQRANAVVDGTLQTPAAHNQEFLVLAAQVKLNSQQWDEAQHIADRLSGLEQTSSIASEIKGAAFMGQQEYDQSIAAFKESFDQAADNTRPMVAMVRAYVSMGEPARAKTFIDSVLAVSPDNIAALMLRAELYRFEQDVSSAADTYRFIISKQPEALTAYRALARLLLQQEKPAEALDVLAAGITAVPGRALSLKLMGANIYEQLGRTAEAIDVYESVLRDDESIDIAANNLAVIYTDREGFVDLEKAKALSERFRQSEIPYFQDTVGWVNLKLGNLNDALYFHENAVESMPEFGEFRYHLGMAYKASGDLDKARFELEKSISLSEASSPAWLSDAQSQLSTL